MTCISPEIVSNLIISPFILEEPVSIEVTFWFKRPKSHYYANGQLRQYQPVYITSQKKGDLDKLCRSLNDGLTGSAFADDKQVVKIVAEKNNYLHHKI